MDPGAIDQARLQELKFDVDELTAKEKMRRVISDGPGAHEAPPLFNMVSWIARPGVKESKIR